MGLKNMSLLTGATIAATGGTALSFQDTGVTIQNGVQLIVPTDTVYATRRTCVCKTRPPVLDPKTGVYGKEKRSIVFVDPTTDPLTGKITFNTIRIEREVSSSIDAAQAVSMNNIGAQLLTASDLEAFWATGSTT